MTSVISRFKWQVRAIFALAFTLLFTLASVTSAFASVSLIKLSSDPYTNSTSQHKTEVEPDTFSFGSTIVATVQAGRFPAPSGGSSNIGWATSTNNGATWKHGFLPGTTVYATPPGSFARDTDPSVAYDAKHKVWLISSLPIFSNLVGAAVIVNRSTDGGFTWSNPVTVSNQGSNTLLDKDWIVCDDTSTSPFYGHCYVEWDNNAKGNLIEMSTSTDGGTTWGAFKTTANHATGLGGQPLVQPSGTVLVPIDNANETAVLAFSSTNGGTSWGNAVVVQTISSHTEAGGLRSGPLISAEMDKSGTAYVFWQDCRFVSGCAANQLVFVKLTSAAPTSLVSRVPIAAPGSSTLADFFIPGVAVDRSTSGSTAHIAVAFYYYPNTNCSFSTCQLDVGFISSTNGGSSFSPITQLAGPMKLAWLPNTDLGRMVGDYISTSFSAGKAFPGIVVAHTPTVGTDCSASGAVCNEALYTVSGGVTALGGSNATKAGRVVAGSDHPTPSTPLVAH